MKWEILKGSKKDFEGAPEWATLRTFTGGCYFFAEYDGGGAKVLDIARNDEFKSTTPFDPSGISIIAERRPITEPDVNQQVNTEWSGDGLPPVGVECEMLWNKEWVKCAVKAYGDQQFIFKADGHREWAGHINNFSFRPIRSPEDTARDKAIHAMSSSHKPCGHATVGICADIYDAIALGMIPGVKLEASHD